MKVIDVENITIPSANQRLIPSRTSKRWTLHPEYRKFKQDLYKCCRKKKIQGPYKIIIEAHIKGKKDADNIVKSIFDVLQAAEVISNDSHIVSFTVKKYPSRNEKLRVTVLNIEDYYLDDWWAS